MSRKNNIKTLREAKKLNSCVFIIYQNADTKKWGKMGCCPSKAYSAYKMLAKKFDEIDVSRSELSMF